ncbi:4'-phosphopantetheinyl transferase family protein [Acinetobacter sp. ANC 3781]
MTRAIRIAVDKIERIVPLAKELDRKTKIQQQKQAIYHYRNQLLSQQLHATIQQEDFATNEHGKPYLIKFPQFYFNHSHSQKNYALATSSHMPDLGVDLEDLDRKVRFEALAVHAFHPNELRYWNELEQDREYWFKVWTTKEAVLKASGLGIHLNLNELETRVHPIYDGGLCSHPSIGTFAYQNFNLGHAILTVAWRSESSCKGFAFPEIKIIFSS